jgi:hypothetical protein
MLSKVKKKGRILKTAREETNSAYECFNSPNIRLLRRNIIGQKGVA